ncbi:hypothetical protein O181_014666 [Austropuccinia psidii MF-1]|uniref:Uncharacterized protein n=1 Tax=Austropuccinia psidii MF-1 TaxID=1389203 RepID=A0A9Q3C258_9BASI|nr:hypothetical protein [Austropuccinia psidii MF-1]
MDQCWRPIHTDGRPIYSSSEVPICRINNQGVVKRIRILDSPTNPDAEGSAELDGEEVEVVNKLIGHLSSTFPTKPPAKKLHSKVILSIPRNFQPVLPTVPSSIPPPSPNPSTYRAALASQIRPSPIPQPRPSPVLTSQKLKPVDIISRRREEWSPFPFPDAQVFQTRNHWTIRITREDPNVVNEGQYSVARPFRRFNRKWGE